MQSLKGKLLDQASQDERAKLGREKGPHLHKDERSAGYTQNDSKVITRGSTCRILGSKLWWPLTSIGCPAARSREGAPYDKRQYMNQHLVDGATSAYEYTYRTMRIPGAQDMGEQTGWPATYLDQLPRSVVKGSGGQTVCAVKACRAKNGTKQLQATTCRQS